MEELLKWKDDIELYNNMWGDVELIAHSQGAYNAISNASAEDKRTYIERVK